VWFWFLVWLVGWVGGFWFVQLMVSNLTGEEEFERFMNFMELVTGSFAVVGLGSFAFTRDWNYLFLCVPFAAHWISIFITLCWGLVSGKL